ncbi:hypothetical protein J6590_080417 [Homalodisca vitripennis]|nr:hypothetical protein J6590_080417 [Homalodisca vitripennis]
MKSTERRNSSVSCDAALHKAYCQAKRITAQITCCSRSPRLAAPRATTPHPPSPLIALLSVKGFQVQQLPLHCFV